MKFHEDRRNDPVLCTAVSANLKLKAIDAARLSTLVEEMNCIVRSQLWEDNLRLRTLVFTLCEGIPNPTDLLQRADNKTYCGNCAAEGRKT